MERSLCGIELRKSGWNGTSERISDLRWLGTCTGYRFGLHGVQDEIYEPTYAQTEEAQCGLRGVHQLLLSQDATAVHPKPTCHL